MILFKLRKADSRTIRRSFAVFISFAFLFTIASGSSVDAKIDAVPGGPCKKVGQASSYKGKKLKCELNGSRLKWVYVSTKSKASAPSLQGNDLLADDYALFSTPLPRSMVDRPDDGGESSPKVKVIYAVPSFAKDQRRDISGEIARGLFEVEEWRASQNGGFGLRYDTYKGALDIGFMTFESTQQQWYDRFYNTQTYPGLRNGISHFQEDLKAAGWWKGPLISDSNDLANLEAAKIGDFYFVVFEAPAGAYARTGAGEGTCRSLTDATNDGVPIVGWTSIEGNGRACNQVDAGGRFNFKAAGVTQNQWIAKKYGMIDHFNQWMRNLPGCGTPTTPKTGQPVKIPGVTDESKAWEIRGGFNRDLSEPNDPNAAIVTSGVAVSSPPMLDPRHDLYFHITSDKLAGLGSCNSDISRHPLWDDKPLDRRSERTLLRSSYDRPDDISGQQFHAVYVVPFGTSDLMYDTGGDIERSMRNAEQWVRSQSGKNIRIDTYQGKIDVTYLPLPPGFKSISNGDCTKSPCQSDQEIYAHLNSFGRTDSGKTYIFFYTGAVANYALCGWNGVKHCIQD